MASTNKTLNYELSQFIGTDKPSWLTDYNGDMIKIDLEIKTIEDLITGVNSQINYITETELLTKANKENPIITGVMDLQGGRIKFPVSNIASSDPNTLDDYEEGTFNPTIIGSVILGFGTYDVQYGKYLKIGSQVTVDIYIKLTNHTGTGHMYIDGLPFTPIDFSSAVIGSFEGLSLLPDNMPTAYTNGGKIVLLQTPIGGGTVNVIPIDTLFEIVISLTYRVN